MTLNIFVRERIRVFDFIKTIGRKIVRAADYLIDNGRKFIQKVYLRIKRGRGPPVSRRFYTKKGGTL